MVDVLWEEDQLAKWTFAAQTKGNDPSFISPLCGDSDQVVVVSEGFFGQ
jgi:hypothetical protein